MCPPIKNTWGHGYHVFLYTHKVSQSALRTNKVGLRTRCYHIYNILYIFRTLTRDRRTFEGVSCVWVAQSSAWIFCRILCRNLCGGFAFLAFQSARFDVRGSEKRDLLAKVEKQCFSKSRIRKKSRTSRHFWISAQKSGAPKIKGARFGAKRREQRNMARFFQSWAHFGKKEFCEVRISEKEAPRAPQRKPSSPLLHRNSKKHVFPVFLRESIFRGQS